MNPEESHWISALLKLASPPLKCIYAHAKHEFVLSNLKGRAGCTAALLLLYSWSQLYYPEAAWWFGNPNQTEHVLTVAPAELESSCGGQLAWRKLGPSRWVSPTSVPPQHLHISSVSWALAWSLPMAPSRCAWCLALHPAPSRVWGFCLLRFPCLCTVLS